MKPTELSLVSTIRERCRVCYTCVRECPAKAIRIAGGQAEVIPSRCIGCGSCIKVCSQGAKRILSSIDDVWALLRSGAQVAACVAPSYPAEFGDWDSRHMVGVLRKMGFSLVCEVAFGADLVARAYRELLAERPQNSYIATACPAIVNFVERYHPDLIPHLAPIASPMLAMSRALRARYGADLKSVFIGPCIAKKGEAAFLPESDHIDSVLTFRELREMFESAGISCQNVTPSDFDPPRSAMGGVFPLPRGSLQTAGIEEDLASNAVLAADGRKAFPEALQEFAAGDLNVQLLELLCCRGGCVMGAGMSVDVPPFVRRAQVSQEVQTHRASFDETVWSKEMEHLRGLQLSRTFQSASQSLPNPTPDEIRTVMEEMGKLGPDDELNCGACGYDTCRAHAIAILRGLAEDEMCLPFAVESLRKTVQKLDLSNVKLASTQQALVQAEKLASMGQLAAGIAHEVNNPLGVVLLYAHVLLEACERDSSLQKDLTLIVEQADRCKKIVSGLLNFARQSKVVLLPTSVSDLVARTLRGVPTPDGIEVRVEHQDAAALADLDADQMRQVLTNLLSNALAAMPSGGRLKVCTRVDQEHVWFEVEDTGVGIPKENLNRIFEPFFTTKQIGRGTGLGLAVSYGIVKMHRGSIQLKSNADPAAGHTGSTFTVKLPRFERREDAASFFALKREDAKTLNEFFTSTFVSPHMTAALNKNERTENLEAVSMDTLRVLVIDDELGMRLGASRVLEGFRVELPETDGQVRLQVEQAESGEEALDKMVAQKFDIILLDHKLPGLSGLDVLERLHQRRDDALVIMITAYASLEVAVSATKSGAFDFLAKPFTPDELRDTVRKAARHHLLRWQARQLAQEKRQVRFQFLSVLVHELKAPLAAVEGYLRLLQEGAAGDPATTARVIDRSLVRLDGMRKLIMDLLDLTRIESGQKLREMVDVDVVEVARAAIETALPTAQERAITLELHASAPVVMQADRGEIEIMLNNLVSNAVKYNREQGRVDVTIAGGVEGVTMTVKDTGIGMSKEETAKLFGEFVRIKNVKTRNIMGSGLGLSILRKLANMYGGNVTVESQPDVGTTFAVRLPAGAAHNVHS